MQAPESYIEWINAHLGFNPRSQANSNALSDFVIADLRKSCPSLAGHVASELVVPSKNADVRTSALKKTFLQPLESPDRATHARYWSLESESSPQTI